MSPVATDLARLTDVTMRFEAEGPPALDGISATIGGGAVTGLVGPDGAGKTTFLRLLTGLLLPASGEVEALGFSTVTEPSGAIGASRRGAPAVDVVLGDRFGSSCASDFVDEIEASFARAGFRVARNTPFAGGYITEPLWSTGLRRQRASDRDRSRDVSGPIDDYAKRRLRSVTLRFGAGDRRYLRRHRRTGRARKPRFAAE